MKNLLLTGAAVAALVVVLGPLRSSGEGHAAVTCHYQAGGALPDKTCSPGALNPVVKQSTIKTTICHRGWTKTIRPPVAVTERIKFEQMREYGDSTAKGQAAKYEEDHIVPLEVGGAPADKRNLFPEPRDVRVNGVQEGSHVKDHVENRLRVLVCDGKMSLAAAQTVFLTDWRKGR